MRKSLSPETFDQVVLELFELEMEWFFTRPTHPSEYKNNHHMDLLNEFLQAMIKRSAINDFPVPFSVFDPHSILREMGIEDIADDLTLKKFENTLHSIMVYWQNNMELKLNGDLVKLETSVSNEHKKYKDRAFIFSNTINSNDTLTPNSIIPTRFSEVASAFLKHLQQSKGKKAPASTSLQDYTAKLKIYELILEDISFNEIKKQHIVECKNLTYNLPRNMNKIRWRDTHKSLKDLIYDQGHAYQRIEITTVSKYLSQLKKICLFAYENNYCSQNPGESVRFDYTKEVQNERKPFTNNELTTIFNGYIYSAKTRPPRLKLKPFQFWLPLLGAYTGARLNELCSLYLEDIKYDQDVNSYFFDINGNHSDKKLKTKSSNRLIPVAQVLIDTGLLEYIEEIKNRSPRRLFPELKHNNKEGYGKEPSRWFNKLEKYGNSYQKGYLALIGIKTPDSPPQSKNFHCFRHTFVHNLKNNPEIDITRVADLVGHENGELQTQSYGGRGYSMAIKKNTIDKLEYHIDISHVHWKNFRRILTL